MLILEETYTEVYNAWGKILLYFEIIVKKKWLREQDLKLEDN